MRTIPVQEEGDPDNPRLQIDEGKCDVCGYSRPCLTADNSAGEYGPVRICRLCIEEQFLLA